MNNFKELNVWKKSMELVAEIYQITDQFPPKEQFGLISQMRRVATSIPSNIAEVAGRMSTKEFEHFLFISMGSSYELETQILISRELSYIKPEICDEMENNTTEIQKMIRGLQKSQDNK